MILPIIYAHPDDPAHKGKYDDVLQGREDKPAAEDQRKDPRDDPDDDGDG